MNYLNVMIIVLIIILVLISVMRVFSRENMEIHDIDVMLKSFNGMSPNVKRKTLHLITNLFYKPSPFPVASILGGDLPQFFNWRDKVWLTPVMNQYSCGGCWAFATVGAMADRLSIMTKEKTKVVLSPQYLISCDTQELGCQGATSLTDVYEAMTDVKRLGGTFLFSDYPFDTNQQENDRGDPCKRFLAQKLQQAKKTFFSFAAVESLSAGGIEESIRRIKESILQYGPVTAGISIYRNIYNYNGEGVLEYDQNSAFVGGHAIDVIGWGEDERGGYWIIKNSWGPDWGDKGYFKQRMGVPQFGLEVDAHSGIPKLPESPVFGGLYTHAEELLKADAENK